MEERDRDLYNERFCNIGKTLDEHEDRISVTEEKYHNMDKQIMDLLNKINIAFDKISELPSVLKEISGNMSGMEKRLETNTYEINTLKEAVGNQGKVIKRIDSESKLNIVEWIKNNWFSIMTVIILVIYIGKDMIGN